MNNSIFRKLQRLGLAVCLALLGLALLLVTHNRFTLSDAWAQATINVTTTNDVVDAGSGNCSTLTVGDLPGTDTFVSLREAVCVANNTPGADQINLPVGTYNLTIAGANEDDAATGDLDITEGLTIAGINDSTTIIDGGDLDRVFHITGTTGVVSFSDVTIQNGSSTGDGGGIFNASAATLNVDDSTILNNEVTGVGEDGGGIANTGGGTANITNSSITNNTAPDSGGGLFNSDAGSVMNISGSTISDNDANDQGGGVFNAQTLNIENTTISANTAITNGGGIAADFTSSVVSLDNVDVDGNSSGQDGGGIYNARGDMDIDNGSTISGNDTGRDGGGLANEAGGTLNINNSTISGNEALGANEDGGGLFNTGNGVVNITNSLLTGNLAADSGGGIFNSGATIVSTVNISNTTISGNNANDQGGGIYSAQVTNLTNSTISGNTASNDGGGLASDFDTSAVTMNNVTIADNTATSGSGGGVFRGISSGGGVINVANTIIADNNGSNPDCSGTLTSQGNNLIGDLTGCLGTVGSDLTGVNPLLGPLQLNAPGSTETHALQLGSPAIDTANNTCPPTDQRGQARVNQVGVGSETGTPCDIGAYEFSPAVTVPALSIQGPPSQAEGDAGTSTATFTVTLGSTIATTVTVDYATSNDTATAGSDYVATNGTLTFLPNTSGSQPINVTINGDTTAELDETFTVSLSNANWATISGSGQAQGTILNDDDPVVIIGNETVTEGDSGTKAVTLTVTLSLPPASEATVSYNTVDGSAMVGLDYVAASGVVTFPIGVDSQEITVQIIGDGDEESQESFFVVLNSATGSAILPNPQDRAEVTINDNDGSTFIYLPLVTKEED